MIDHARYLPQTPPSNTQSLTMPFNHYQHQQQQPIIQQENKKTFYGIQAEDYKTT